MAGMIRDEFVTELQARGWSRFAAVDLQKYLNWGLQDVYRLGKFPLTNDASATAAFAADDFSIPYGVIESGGTSLIHSIDAVYLKDAGGNPYKLDSASNHEFLATIYPNTLRTAVGRIKNLPIEYYAQGETLYFYPAADQAYVWVVQYTKRADIFTAGGANSGLPERFDIGVLFATEVHCARRARDYDAMAVAANALDKFIADETATENKGFDEEYPRVERYVHGIQ